ncbi:hypothetical protein T492DRAFT_952328 [Pavlovales sp. CCMP2436]|nr:hypothetical protein T492DRAFT_952328 [Pavlovales sp. CCMP2436]
MSQPPPFNLLSRRQAVLEASLVAARALLTPADGQEVGIWLLTAVNHWNLEQERLIVLSANALYRVKFNFLQQRVEKSTRLRLADFESITLGRVRYASQSIAEGLQTLSRGAPLARSGVRITLRGEEGGEGLALIEPLESVDDFQSALQRTLAGIEGLEVVPIVSDIVLDSVLGIPALVYNENRWKCPCCFSGVRLARQKAYESVFLRYGRCIA